MKYSILSKLTFLVLSALALAPLCTAQSQIAGDWQGKLNGGGMEFRVAWHVVAAKDGSFTSTLDNLDQGIFAIPVKSTTINGSHVALTVDDDVQANGESVHVKGVFEGAFDKDATELKGTWTQIEPAQPPAELDLKHVSAQAAAKPAAASDQITGDWIGAIDVRGSQLRLAMHVTAAKDGGLTATLDSVDQGIFGIQVTTVTFFDSKLSLQIDALNGSYEGTVNKDGTAIDGTWTQGDGIPLTFKHGTVPAPAVAKPAAPSDIDGIWEGATEQNGAKLRIFVKIVNTESGLTAAMQSPDQSPLWAQASSVSRKGSSITISFTGLSLVYDGQIAADLALIDGKLSQGDQGGPLLLKRSKEPAK
jgi:hypothetical protein